VEASSHDEERKYARYDSNLKIEFQVNFDVETKINFRVKKKNEMQYSPQKYPAVSNNISVEGIGFTSHKKLNKGDQLLLDVYVPASEKPIRMQAETRWCRKSSYHKDEENAYDTGVEVHRIDDQVLRTTIFHDKENNVIWSSLLDAVFSNFKHIMAEKKHK